MKAGGGEHCTDCWNFFRLSCFFFKGEVSGGWVLEAGNIAMELVSQSFPRDHFGPDRHSRATPALIWKQIDLTCVCLICRFVCMVEEFLESKNGKYHLQYLFNQV